MKKLLLSILALAAISTTALAQTSPFEWTLGDKTKIKLGGFVRFNINSDFNGSVGAGNDFVSTNIPETTAWSSEDYLNFDPSATRLSMEINQSTDAFGNVKAYVEGDFRGTGNTLRLRQAYIELKGFVAGFAWSFMSDLAANAPTIDINGVGSRTFLRTKMVGYRHNLSETLSAGIAIEVPSLTTEYLDGYTALNQTVPNIPLYIQAKGGAGHIKASAVIRSLRYGDTSAQESQSELGLGGQLSGSLKATKAITLYGQAIYGKGINTYISNLASVSVDLMSTDYLEMEATPMGGASLGVGAKLSKKWSAAMSGSLVRNYGDQEYFEGQFKSTSYLATTLLYAPAPRVTLGAEYLNGSRTNFGSETASADRFSLMIKYTL